MSLEKSSKKLSKDPKLPLRLGILISGGGTTMVNIAQLIKKGDLNAEIAIVISSNPNAGGVEKAHTLGLETHVVQRSHFDSADGFSHQIWSLLRGVKVNLVCMAGFLSLINIPDDYSGRVINIHPALLPSFGGKGMYGHHVHEAVLAAGCKVSGCTVHFADGEYDRGPIIVQRTCPVEEGDTPDALGARVFQQECIAYPQAIKLFGEGRLTIDGRVVQITAPGS